MEAIKIVGSDETVVQVGRVPAMGEYVETRGVPRRVTRVLHTPMPWNPWPTGIGAVQWSTVIGEAVTTVATVTVADD